MRHGRHDRGLVQCESTPTCRIHSHLTRPGAAPTLAPGATAPAARIHEGRGGQVNSSSRRRRTGVWVLALAATIAGGTAAVGSAGPKAKQVRVAYLSFAVANSYDAPMLAAAK